MRRFAISLGITAALIGTTAAPAAAHTISPPSADFGAVRIGGGGASLQFTLTAVGTSFRSSDLTVTGPDTTTFTFVPGSSTCRMAEVPTPTGGTAVPPGGSCSFSVQFFPRTPGVKTGTVGIPGAMATLTGTAVSAGKKCKKKGKKGAVAAKKCKKGKK